MGKEKPVNILYLSYDGMTDPLGESQVIPYLKGLGTSYTVWLISFEKEERFKADGSRIQLYLDQSKIHWVPLKYHKNPPIISTIFDLLTLHRKARLVVKKASIQLVHCRSYPSGLVGLYLKRKYGVKFLFDIRGFWANERVDGEIWNLRNPIYWLIYMFFKRKEVQMMNEADHIISLTHAGKEEIVSGRLFEFPSNPIEVSKVTVIPCAVDLELFDPEKISEVQKQNMKEKLGLKPREKILCYLGSVGTWYMLDEMLLFFKKWKDSNSFCKFLFVTPDEPNTILNQAEKKGLIESDLIICKASRKEVPVFLSITDLGIFYIKTAYSKKASSATKMGELIAMKVPFITNAGVGDGDFIVPNYGVGWLINPSEEIDFPLIASNLELNYSEARTHFSLENGVKAYHSVYQKLS